MFNDYSNMEIVKKNPELSNITFERKIGFNVVNINPMNCDMYAVERHIINIIRNMVEIFKYYIGYYTSLKYFIEENIFDYLLSNFSLLNDLNLFTFLLQLFLIK
jgi:hypothetical protein